METLGKITLFIMLLVASFLISIFEAFVIQKIGILYDLQIILQFSFVQLVGLIYIIQMIIYKYEKPEVDSFQSNTINAFTSLFSKAALYLISWLMLIILYSILI